MSVNKQKFRVYFEEALRLALVGAKRKPKLKDKEIQLHLEGVSVCSIDEATKRLFLGGKRFYRFIDVAAHFSDSKRIVVHAETDDICSWEESGTEASDGPFFVMEPAELAVYEDFSILRAARLYIGTSLLIVITAISQMLVRDHSWRIDTWTFDYGTLFSSFHNEDWVMIGIMLGLGSLAILAGMLFRWRQDVASMPTIRTLLLSGLPIVAMPFLIDFISKEVF